MVDWARLNMDGFVLGISDPTTGRDLIRDHSGHWISGFSRKIGRTSSVAVVMRFTNMVVELDALVLVFFLNNSIEANYFLSLMIANISFTVSPIKRSFMCRGKLIKVPMLCIPDS